MRSRFQYSASACARRWYSGSSDRTRGNGAPSESVVAESTARECIEVPAPRATSSDGGLVDVPGRRLVGGGGRKPSLSALSSHFIMFASDYPHWDSDFPNSTKPLRECRDISDAVRAKIVGENAERFCRLAA